MFTLLLLIGLNAGAPSLSPSVPPMPYLDWGACPFECCTYRTWSVLRRTSVLSSRKAGAPVAFHLNAGEKVEGITGVVITTRPGRIKVVAPITLGEPANSVA